MVASQETDLQAGKSRKRTKQERLERASKGLQVHVMGLSIHHAQVEVREKLAIPEDSWNDASNEICDSGAVAEAAVLSTCNRFEIYFAASDARPGMARVTEYLAARSGLPVSKLRQNLFMLSGDDAVWHLMRVAGGLDSLIVGEGQILSQVRQCHLHSIEEDGCGGKVLSRLLNTAVAAGKRVRSETAISKGSVSISSAAVELSEMLAMGDLNLPFSECRLAVIGAGTMTRLLITHLASRGLERITIVNRSMARPNELKEQFPDIDIEVKLNEDLWDVVGRSDIVYTATSSPGYIITEEELQKNGLADGRPLMLVDIAVPRNISPDTSNVDGVRAYNVDDLKAVVAKNTALRQREMIEAEILLTEEGDGFSEWRESLSAIPTINSLQEKAEGFREQEMKKTLKKLNGLTGQEVEAVERLSRGIVNKMLHGPMSHLRRVEGVEEKKLALQELTNMFKLDEEDERKGRKQTRRR
eukprot:CAMPEP_0113309394 /NCGR_PEP_ID=MMETSP0010_2-20120614/7459_1 /TAXON_ID=216773 ORGANISM="Corethron hystrix, Strain 308" /NCGR_SAMPLE_ID=MMETSP0010_2 /ASSEMBLY_ACC=CAM_ASM_000155 /LENGTH=471 /DNA_ID=CAMNT_0000164645 /DNA_START=321 /DNA_END=1736 /DNA_ORIENTATION=+ /assembly_acc=CAM_ASM_000155